MKRILSIILFVISVQADFAQTIEEKLAQAVQQFEADSQMRHAIMSLCVADAKTGRIVYAHNEQIGLAPASTQKIFTSVAAFELLGKDYRYKTEIGYKAKNAMYEFGYFMINPSGDPTFGSWRYNSTKPELMLNNVTRQIKRQGIKKISSSMESRQGDFSMINTPRGWIWEDIGNYYGAGAHKFNWRENQFDFILRSGKNIGDSVTVIGINPSDYKLGYISNVTSAEKGSGDNAYVFSESYWTLPVIEGTIPVNEDSFTISASASDPENYFKEQLLNKLKQQGVQIIETGWNRSYPGSDVYNKEKDSYTYLPLYTHLSPPLDSINYWFLKKSVNLYGEALIKTFAIEKKQYGSTENGVKLLKDFWSQHGIDKAAVNVIDGSGLSPQNRVTTDAEVKVLQYAKTRPWFSSFYNALPEFNGMKMKSGSIGGARAYTGYHTASNGTQYIFSVIVNNYDGSSSEAVKKIYRILDMLK